MHLKSDSSRSNYKFPFIKNFGEKEDPLKYEEFVRRYNEKNNRFLEKRDVIVIQFSFEITNKAKYFKFIL